MVFSGNYERKDSKESFDCVRSHKGIRFKAGDNFDKICKAKPATFLSPEDSNCTDESQSSTNQKNGVLSRLDPNDKSRVFERNLNDDGVFPENELRRSGRVRTRRKIYDAESGTYKPV